MAWLNGKKVQALWTHETRANSWAWIDGAWRKFHDANSDACTNFTILAAHAKDGNRDVNVFVDRDRLTISWQARRHIVRILADVDH